MTVGRQFPSPLLTELRPLRSDRFIESPIVEVGAFDRAVLSWNGAGVWRFDLRVRVGSEWSPYLPMGFMNGFQLRSATRDEERAALSGTRLPISLDTDTLMLKGGASGNAIQVRATGDGNLTALTVTHYRRDDRAYTDRPAAPAAWGTAIPVPQRRQGDCEDTAIRPSVCSPTSLSMVLAHYGKPLRIVDTCRAAYDSTAKIYGNWPCNTAAAARITGGWSAVVKMRGFDEVEREIAANRPVILSHRWNPGELTDAPVSRSDGHLIVCVGFTETGDVVVNDPAGKPGTIRRTYKRPELFHTWQERGEGIAYLVHAA